MTKQEYLAPEAEEIQVRLEITVMSPGGTGSNMEEPEEWNPF